MRIMLCLGLIILTAPLGFPKQPSPSPQAPPKELPKLEHFNTANVDSKAEPCDDFYKYADGKWLAAHPIPADQVGWGSASTLQLWNETILLQALEQNSSDNPKRTPNEQKVGDFYFACMDTKAIDAHTAEWLKPELERISSIKDKAGIVEEVAHLHQTIPGAWAGNDNETDAALFGFGGGPDFDDASHNVAGIDQGGMALPGRSFYLDDDAKAKEIRAKYLSHIANIFVLSGETAEQAKADADVVLNMETDMAKVAMDPVARRDPKNLNNKMTLAQVKALTPSFDWGLYFKLVKVPPTPHYIVTSPAFFKGIEVMLNQHPLEHWKTYLRWQMLHGNAPTLSDAFERENFDFFRRTLFGAQELLPRWRRCVRATDVNVGEALGQVYVERAFPSTSKQRVLQMVRDLQLALSKDIDSADWMTPETKKQAQQKLHATLNKIGYPDKWRDYSSVSISRSSYLTNRQHTAAFEYQRWVDKIGTPFDRTEWEMTPPTINAYEGPQSNTINFPAGILQPPFFDPQLDDAVNYGGIGAVIGHEIIHGFDDQGRKFDAQGNLRDWWTESDSKTYEARGKCIADQYTQDVPEAGPGVRQNGRLTQGEDTADNGGLHIALLALQTGMAREGKSLNDKGPDGFTALQRFFISYAFGWCEQYRPELIRTLVLTNPHSYPKYRVNNVVSNMPEFKQAFGCHDGQKMVHQNFCRIWQQALAVSGTITLGTLTANSSGFDDPIPLAWLVRETGKVWFCADSTSASTDMDGFGIQQDLPSGCYHEVQQAAEMKLEFLPDGRNDSGLIRLYDYSSCEVRELRKLTGELATGTRERTILNEESWVAPVEGCKLILWRGERNSGVRQLGSLDFECELSADGWNNIEGLLEPFCNSATKGFQWLTNQGRISFLISHNGRW